jgi:hypothetical protein
VKRRALTPAGLPRAFDELRFGPARTLDLRSSRPSARDAESRADAWLRERQSTIRGEVLIITGRGKGSYGGEAVVRPAVLKRLGRLQRQGVVADVREHTPGSFAVKLAPLSELLTAPRRIKDPPPGRAAAPEAVAGLRPATIAALRALAERSLEVLGAPRTAQLVEAEMAHHFSRLVLAVGKGPDREARLRAAARAARDELDNA